MALLTMGAGGHYITMLPADCSISTSHDTLSSVCHSEKMLWNPSLVNVGSLYGRLLALSFPCKEGTDL